jgi:pantoate kinase
MASHASEESAEHGYGAAGWCAIILAIALGGGFVFGLVTLSLPYTTGTHDADAQLLNGLGQVLAGAVATFLGSQIPSVRRAFAHPENERELDDESRKP